MPRRLILTDAERRTILALPTDEAALIRHWSLDDQDLALLDTRHRDDTRLCAAGGDGDRRIDHGLKVMGLGMAANAPIPQHGGPTSGNRGGAGFG